MGSQIIDNIADYIEIVTACVILALAIRRQVDTPKGAANVLAGIALCVVVILVALIAMFVALVR